MSRRPGYRSKRHPWTESGLQFVLRTYSDWLMSWVPDYISSPVANQASRAAGQSNKINLILKKIKLVLNLLTVGYFNLY